LHRNTEIYKSNLACRGLKFLQKANKTQDIDEE